MLNPFFLGIVLIHNLRVIFLSYFSGQRALNLFHISNKGSVDLKPAEMFLSAQHVSIHEE
jgi:hypothetical protein